MKEDLIMNDGVKFYYPANHNICTDIDFIRKKNNKEQGYIDYSDYNKSDYFYGIIKLILVNKMLSQGCNNKKEITQLLKDIHKFQRDIYVVSVKDNYKHLENSVEIYEKDKKTVLDESMHISNAFIELFPHDPNYIPIDIYKGQTSMNFDDLKFLLELGNGEITKQKIVEEYLKGNISLEDVKNLDENAKWEDDTRDE